MNLGWNNIGLQHQDQVDQRQDTSINGQMQTNQLLQPGNQNMQGLGASNGFGQQLQNQVTQNQGGNNQWSLFNPVNAQNAVGQYPGNGTELQRNNNPFQNAHTPNANNN